MLCSTLILSMAAAPGLTFAEAVGQAEGHPAVTSAAVELEARREADAEISALTNQPTLFVSPGYRFFSEADRGFEGTLGLSQGWNLGSPGGARRAAASAERDVLAQQRRARLLQVEVMVARHWIGLRRSEAVLALVRAQLTAAEVTRSRVVTALDGARAERAEVELYTAEMRRALLEAEAEIFHARLDLAVALGRPPDDELRTEGPEPRSDPPRSLQPCVHNVPRLRAARAEAKAADLRARAAEAAGAPVLSTGISAQRESPDGWIGFLNLSLSLPVIDPQARAVGQARGRAAAQKERVRGARMAVVRRLALLRHELEHARETVQLYENALLPAAEALLSARRAGFEAGEVTVWALLRAQREHLRLTRESLDARAEDNWAHARVNLLARRCATEDQ